MAERWQGVSWGVPFKEMSALLRVTGETKKMTEGVYRPTIGVRVREVRGL